MFTVQYHARIPNDLAPLPVTVRQRVRIAIEKKLASKPEVFGKPLRHSLLGFRSLRVGDYRVVYLIRETDVYVVIIAHRKHVYDLANKRT
jgi:mRNA interferase RelE/StbE